MYGLEIMLPPSVLVYNAWWIRTGGNMVYSAMEKTTLRALNHTNMTVPDGKSEDDTENLPTATLVSLILV